MGEGHSFSKSTGFNHAAGRKAVEREKTFPDAAQGKVASRVKKKGTSLPTREKKKKKSLGGEDSGKKTSSLEESAARPGGKTTGRRQYPGRKRTTIHSMGGAECRGKELNPWKEKGKERLSRIGKVSFYKNNFSALF